MKYFTLFATFCVVLNGVLSASTSKTPVVTSDNPDTTQKTTSKPPPTDAPTSSPVTTPKLSPTEECEKANASCDACVKVGSVQCLWCASSNKCILKEHLIPTSECGLADAKWAVCWVNYEALIIACSVIGGILILALTICICCCCCCKGNKNAKYVKEDAKYERKKADMKAGQAERRAERKAKTDEIRKKYGLIKEDNPYSRFENN